MELEELRAWRKNMSKSMLLRNCSTYNHETAWKQARKHGNTAWIFRNDLYKNWKEAPVGATLWCTRIVGSGKTVLSANCVEDLVLNTGDSIVSYFFCRYNEAESLKARTAIGSIARQLISPIDSDRIASIDGIHKDIAFDSEQILELLQKLLSPKQKYFIVVDGLDDCPHEECGVLLDFLHGVGSAGNVWIYCSCRPDVLWKLPQFLKPPLVIHMSRFDTGIDSYIDQALSDNTAAGKLVIGDPALLGAIREALLQGAQGM